MLNEDIIPISYSGGTGGNFLCHFLIGAKRNIKQLPVLSEYGNAHYDCLKDFKSVWFTVNGSDLLNIKAMLRQPAYTTEEKPYFAAAHLIDANLVNSYFKRSIRITFEIDDINEVSSSFFGKFIKSAEFKIIETTHNLPTTTLTDIIASNVINSTLFVKDESLTNILFISWKELFKGDIEELILKLSLFTNINPDNFSRESIILWREKTQYCLDTFDIHNEPKD
jgi:hypothetical protein